MDVFLTGGTGTIGRALVAALLERGDHPVVLTRNIEKARAIWPSDRVILVEGDPAYVGTDSGAWQDAISGCDAVVNLAGEPIDGERFTAQFRQRIHDSRVDSTRFVAEGICKCAPDDRPKILLSASGIDYYGFSSIEMFDKDEIDETAPGGESFLAGLCWDWEDETRICKDAGVRIALMRTGLVLSKTGALTKMAAPFRMGVGGKLGSGKQWMSWVHIDDVVGAYLHALDNEIEGAVNVVSPGNVRNREFSKAVASALGTRSRIPVPEFAIKAAVGGLAEYMLKGRRAVPGVLTQSGYEFVFPEVTSAVISLLKT